MFRFNRLHQLLFVHVNEDHKRFCKVTHLLHMFWELHVVTSERMSHSVSVGVCLRYLLCQPADVFERAVCVGARVAQEGVDMGQHLWQ